MRWAGAPRWVAAGAVHPAVTLEYWSRFGQPGGDVEDRRAAQDLLNQK